MVLWSYIGLGMAWQVRPRGVNGTVPDIGTAALPDYVLTYGMEILFCYVLCQAAANNSTAPLIWIHSQDPYNPGDIGGFLDHVIPQIDHATIENYPCPLTLDNLNALNGLGGDKIFLTSKEGIRALPSWFEGTKPNAQGKTEGAVSSVIVTTDRGEGAVDAYYFYWYPYVLAFMWDRVLR